MRATRIGFGILTLTTALAAAAGAQDDHGRTVLRDVTTWEGVDYNDLRGMGIVVGLAGTGDRNAAALTRARNLMQSAGWEVSANDFRSRSVALVYVSARIPPYLQRGQEFDVQVSAIGDATSLEKGILVPTPLQGPGNPLPGDDPAAIGYAQGPVSIGNVDGESHPTSGAVVRGGRILREIPQRDHDADYVLLAPPVDDLDAVTDLADRVNEGLRARPDVPTIGEPLARVRARDAVELTVPTALRGDPVRLVRVLEEILDGEGRVVGLGRLKLRLATPNVSDAQRVAELVNNELRVRGLPAGARGGSGLREVGEDVRRGAVRPEMARVLDDIRVEVTIPADLWSEADRQRFKARIETLPVPFLTQREVVWIDEKTGAVSVTGNVVVFPGLVEVAGQIFHVEREQSLSSFLWDLHMPTGPRGAPEPEQSPRPTLVAPQDLIVLLRTMASSGMIRARIETQ